MISEDWLIEYPAMRSQVLLLVLLIGVAAAPGLGHAEKVRTNQSTKIRNRPGEQGKVLVKLKEGQVVTVLAKEGRWLKVRASGRTGYIPRTMVDMPNDEEIARNTRRRPFVDGRGTKRGFGGDDRAPEDRVGADATGETAPSGSDEEDDEGGDDDENPVASRRGGGGDDDDGDDGDDEDAEEVEDDRIRARVASKSPLYDDADDESDESYTARPSDTLYVIEEKGKWAFVETEDGDAGWIQLSKLDIQESGGGGAGKRSITVMGRLGVALLNQSMTAAGGSTAWPDRYRLGSSAAAVALGGRMLSPYKAKFLVGGELTWDIAKAVPGIAFDPPDPMVPSSTTGFTRHIVRARAVGGYDFKKKSGMAVFAHLGYHYESFLVANVETLTKNTARLPSEIVKGPSLGLSFALPRLTDKIGLRFHLDSLFVGASLTQTKNLEDGANPQASRLTVGGLLTYRWKPELDIQVAYDLNHGAYKFGAAPMMSQRGHTGTAFARTDLSHTVAVGVAKAF